VFHDVLVRVVVRCFGSIGIVGSRSYSCIVHFSFGSGDEMGLGKTLQTISLLCHLKEKEGITGPSLVICPLSVLYSWCNELKKWAPNLKILRFHSSSPEERESQRNILQQDAQSYDVIITTYEMAKNPHLKSLWSRQFFNYLVLDEGHKIKDHNSLIAQAVRGIHRENALILTGTPLQNNLVELWSLINFLYPDIFVSSEPFAQAFDIANNVVDKETLQNAQKLLSLVMLRRLKDQVEKLMPKKIETKVLCPLSSTQVYWYKALLMKDIGTLANSVGDGQTAGGGKGKVLSNLIMQLRKCCLHPFLFPGAEQDPDETSVEDLIASSGKLAVLDKLLCSLYQKGHRTVLFSQFTSVLDILEDYCVLRQWSFCRFDGSTARATRNCIVNSFNEPGSDKFIFLMSTRSGGMGLNLQTADTCILYDSDWNPQPDLQAMARVHRIGQTKTVHVYRLISNGTIEERMVERQEKKLYMDRMVNSTGGAGVNNQDESVDQITEHDMISTLQFGCDAVFGQDTESKNCLPTDEDIEFITDRSRSQDFSGGNLKGGTASKTNDFQADKQLYSSQKLAGVDFKKIRDEQRKMERSGTHKLKSLGSITDVWKQIQDQKRERKSRLVMVDGKNSGYGMKSVPVLASNNYDLKSGESSVFSRELKQTNREAFGVLKRKQKKSGIDFESQDL
jgi:SWI/SNF-related matrix-associated actin-dependent regulator of chromatin subfamily A member 5